MSKKKSSAKAGNNTIALNKKAQHDFFIEQRFEAGIVLEGWEIKSVREGRLQLTDSYVIIREGELWLLGSHITPLTSASTHINADPTRTRKLLLHKDEIRKLIGHVERKGLTLIVLSLYWKKHRVKAELVLAKGKKQHDKRAAMKEKDWSRDKQRILKNRIKD